MTERRITSRQNERVKQVARLRDARDRARQHRFVIDGTREIARALTAGVEIVEVFLCDDLLATAAARELACQLEAACPAVWRVDAPVFEKLAFGARHEGIVAVARAPALSLAALTLPADPLIAVLVGVEKPGNVGAVLRSADGAGVSAVIVADGGTDLFNPNTIRASLGTVFTLPIAVATAAETLTWLRERGISVYASRPDASSPYHLADFSAASAVVLGSEAQGLGPLWQAPEVRGLKLPMHGVADSLNVSATAAVLFYEARRQRDEHPPRQT